MLTAVSVAKRCRMVEQKERVVFVNASPPSHDKPAALKFVLAEHSQGEEQPDVSPEATFRGGFAKPELPVTLQDSLFPTSLPLEAIMDAILPLIKCLL